MFLFSSPGLFLSFFSISDNCFSLGCLGLDFLEGLLIDILFLLLFSFTDWNMNKMFLNFDKKWIHIAEHNSWYNHFKYKTIY